VTVAAEVLVEAEGGYRRDGIHLLAVEVARTGGRLTATSLPTEVPTSSIFPGPLGEPAFPQRR
jgi:hypothetical protein